ncbi:unnamed protein product [Caenorhabditis auriculariae]|uniref:G-protein coupled receptors family 1 profile domain-containing protein n=1 Tax=Caenorhabditis auriculariae TaxID=2777116 RepID=A0A8S1GXX9_9PELO|nr:unnamed protein product [Caenorhabditis auriculariae]
MNESDWLVSAYLRTADAGFSDANNETAVSTSAPMGTVVQEEICRFRATTENFVVVVTFIVIFLLSVIGNSLVLLVILKQRAMRSITNIYLMNLALTDMMLSVVCMPPTLGNSCHLPLHNIRYILSSSRRNWMNYAQKDEAKDRKTMLSTVSTTLFLKADLTVSMVMNCWMFGSFGCKLFAYLQPVVVTASAYTLAVIAFERYFAICRPLHSRIWQTRSHAYVMISLVWTISILANVLMLFMYEQQVYNSNGITCTPIHAPIYHFAYQVYMTVVLLVIPLVVMTVLYGSVINSLKGGIRLEIAAANADSLAAENESQCPRVPLQYSRSHQNLGGGDWLSPFPRAATHLDLVESCAVLQQHPASTDDEILENRKMSFIQKLTQKFSLRKDSNNPKANLAHRRSETSICMDGSSLRSTHNQKSAMAKQRVIKMLIVVVIIFFCCWTPSYIWWLLLIAGDSFQSLQLSVWNSDVNTFITLLTYISSCTNPITYCFLNKKFRNAIYTMFGKKKVLRNHFQKVYMPVNLTSKKVEDRTPIKRSISTNCNPQLQVVFENEPVGQTADSAFLQQSDQKTADLDS